MKKIIIEHETINEVIEIENDTIYDLLLYYSGALKLAKEMRKNQRRYFETKDPGQLKICISLETKFDNLLNGKNGN